MPHTYFCQIGLIKIVEEGSNQECTLEPLEELPKDNHSKGPYPEILRRHLNVLNVSKGF